MALLFEIFDFRLRPVEPGWIWCMRCEAWIPLEEAFGVGLPYDPHPRDHQQAAQLMDRVERRMGDVNG